MKKLKKMNTSRNRNKNGKNRNWQKKRVNTEY